MDIWESGETERLRARKDHAYLERNHLVAALTRLYPSGIKRTNIPGWSQDWSGCVYIDLPTGQISYHYHDSHAWLFKGLPPYEGKWDGHDKETVHQRLALADQRGLCEDDSEKEREIERLKAVNERDRSRVADADTAIMNAIRRREWLRLGRGSYEYDDDRWRDEFSKAIDEVIAATRPLQRIASDLSDCPTDSKKVAEARCLNMLDSWDNGGEANALIDLIEATRRLLRGVEHHDSLGIMIHECDVARFAIEKFPEHMKKEPNSSPITPEEKL